MWIFIYCNKLKPTNRPGRVIAAPCPTSDPEPEFRWIYDYQSRLFMNGAGAAPGLFGDELYRGDGCLSEGIDFWSNATVLALEGRSPSTPTWTWKYKGMGLETKASTGKVTGIVAYTNPCINRTCWHH